MPIQNPIIGLLRGKDKPSFTPNIMPTVEVRIQNASKIKYTGNKLSGKVYYRYSGFPGGIRARTLSMMLEKNPKRVIWLAVYRMLPQNRQRSELMKHLIIED